MSRRQPGGDAGNPPGPAAVDPDDGAAAEEVAARILAGASQSAAALQRRLQRRGFTEEVAAAACAAMIERGYVDDAAFAQSIAGRRLRTGHGRIAVMAELRAKGIADQAIDDIATASDPDGERAAALRLASHLAARPGRDPAEHSGRQKLGAALQRRGFDSETVHWVLRELVRGAEG